MWNNLQTMCNVMWYPLCMRLSRTALQTVTEVMCQWKMLRKFNHFHCLQLTKMCYCLCQCIELCINSSDAGKRKVQTVGYTCGFMSEVCKITVQHSSVESCFKTKQGHILMNIYYCQQAFFRNVHTILKSLLATSCPSICPRGMTRLPLDGF